MSLKVMLNDVARTGNREQCVQEIEPSALGGASLLHSVSDNAIQQQNLNNLLLIPSMTHTFIPAFPTLLISASGCFTGDNPDNRINFDFTLDGVSIPLSSRTIKLGATGGGGTLYMMHSFQLMVTGVTLAAHTFTWRWLSADAPDEVRSVGSIPDFVTPTMFQILELP